MDVPGISRPALAVMSVVAALLLVAGAAQAASWLTQKTDTHTRTLQTAGALQIDADAGDIKVVGSNRSDVRLTTREGRSVFGRPHVNVRYEGGRLTLDDRCTGWHFMGDSCDVDYRLEVPHDLTVRLVTNAGDVRAEDLRGEADLRTTSGDVHVSDVDGILRLRAISGDVHVDSSSTDIEAQSTSGDLHVRATDATRVRAQTTSGDVHVSVPDRTYAVETRTTSGDEHVNVPTDDDAPRRLVATTTSGDVHVAPDG